MGITAGKPSGTALPLQRFSISGPNLGITASFPPFSPSFVHRFLISRPNLGITAENAPDWPYCVQRFLISGPDLRIDVSFSLFSPSFVHRFLISRPDLRIDAAQSSWRGGEWPACYGRSHQPAASDTNFRCCDGRLRPILIFVAAKKNGPPAASVATTIFRVRFHSSLPRKKMARLQRLLRRRSSASDSILRCRKESGSTCSVCCDDNFPRPIQFLDAAKENGSACRPQLDLS